MRNLPILGLFIFVISCNSSSEPIRANNFDISIKATSVLDTIRIPPVLFKERYLTSTDKYLISLGSDRDTLFRVFDNTSGKYLGGFGKEGGGPGEFKTVIGSSLYGTTGNSLYVGDLKTSRIIRISDNPSAQRLTRQDISVDGIHKIPGEFVPFNQSFFVNDSIIAGVKNFYNEKQLAYFNIFNGKIGYFFDYPNLYPEIPETALYHFYNDRFRISKDRSRIASISAKLPLLRIYNIEKQSTEEIYIKTQNDQVPNVIVATNNLEVSLPGLYIYYHDIMVSKDHIYARFQEGQFSEGSKYRLISENQLHVFDFNGKPVVKIILEDWMYRYAVTPDDKFIYFWHPEVENQLFRFPLSEIL